MTVLRQYGLLTRWQLQRQSDYLVFLVIVQAALAAGTVLGFGILMGDVDQASALFLATGAPTITLIVVGLVMAPQVLAQAKTEGSAQWLLTLPVPRLVFLAADLTMWMLIALPGSVLAVVVGTLRYDITLSVAWWVVPAALLVSLTAAAVGYAMAALMPPQLAMVMTQLIVFVVLLFSPISVSADRFPGWLATLHEWLPISPMAEVVRAGLASDVFSVSGRSLAVLVAWCAASVVLAGTALRRRS